VQDAISGWLDGLLSGKVQTSSLQRLPTFPEADAAGQAAGQGAEDEAGPAAEEEEFDLSDIMSVSGVAWLLYRVSGMAAAAGRQQVACNRSCSAGDMCKYDCSLHMKKAVLGVSRAGLPSSRIMSLFLKHACLLARVDCVH
jgi:hypothetical protein